MKFIASLDVLDEMMVYLREQAQKAGMAASLKQKMELACEEAIVNIISYAYDNKAGEIEIECARVRGRFEITLRDWGTPFNPIDVEINPQFGTPIKERKIGGMGIYLIRKIIDEVSYQRNGLENILRLAFNLN